ncbi:hypothetical protein PJP10_32940, partial [Mycobacterium kansasii]
LTFFLKKKKYLIYFFLIKLLADGQQKDFRPLCCKLERSFALSRPSPSRANEEHDTLGVAQ